MGGNLGLALVGNLSSFDLSNTAYRWDFRKYITSWARMMYVDTGKDWVDFYRVGGSNLPVVDPADGSGRIWSNGGVLTVGT